MKKTARNIFFLFLVLIFFFGLAPRLFLLDKVQQKITEEVSHSLASSVTIKKMHWVWLPFPHLTFINTRLTDDHYDFFLPKAKVYPTWRFIMGETDKPGKIILDSPRFSINKKAFIPRETTERNLPEVTVIIRKGELEVEFADQYKDILKTGSLKFNAIGGKLKILPQVLEVDLTGSTPASKRIILQGRLNIPERDYTLLLDAQDIKLHKTVQSFFKGRIIPVESTARLNGTVTGKGLQSLEADLTGTLPCFVLKPQDREIPLTCGFADLKLFKSGSVLRLDINDLEIKDPQVNLSGHIERRLSPISDAEESSSEPVWTLDITGSDLDLTGIREKVLTLWGDNYIAKTVTDIVLGGRALSASYSFMGPAADFKKLEAMIIKADVLNAAIHVPEVQLDLTSASGPIEIKKSILSGHGLSAQLGNSYGHNAELLLDIGHLGNLFKLSIDIDADIPALPPILAQLIDHDGFQRELMKFNVIAGRANGTLYLGDTFDDIQTTVDVKNMQITGRYDPIPKTIRIDSGSLHIGPNRVSWKKVKGNIGGQKIKNTSGYTAWDNVDTVLHIEDLQATLAGASLHAMLRETKAIPQKINNVLSSIDGAIEVSHASLQGPALKPKSWEYDLSLSATGLTIGSPMLPEPLISQSATATITNEAASIENASLQFLDQAFNLKGMLKHQLLEGWYGMIEFNGPLEAKLASWISSHGWFPEKLRPQIPCTMENMQVTWQGKTVAVNGLILQGLGGGRLPMAKIDYVNTPEHLRINELSFYAPGEQGNLELDFWRLSPHSLVFAWEGFVNADTIDALFQHSSFTAGTFSGAFEIGYFADRPEASRFEGLLQADDLVLKTDSSIEPIIITHLDMNGIGRQLRIIDLDLDIGSEKITGAGQLVAEKEGLQLDISLVSSFLSNKSLANLSTAWQETYNVFLSTHASQEPGLQFPRGWDITGRIGFDFDTFLLSRATTTPYAEEQTVNYMFYDINGDLQLVPNKISRTEIFSSKLCGLDFKGFWFSDAALGQKFKIATDPNETFRLENVLPCLGVKQNIIEGEFSLQADLLKETNTWYGGNIYIQSSQGRILRLRTLSRIFKVVNITDLFEEQVGYTGQRGFPYSQMNIDAHIEANNLVLDRAIIRGEGLNLFARGEMHLDDYDADMTLLIAPFKTFDSILSKVPIVGEPIMGEYGSRVSIPVAVKGPIADPEITPLHPTAIGDALLNLVKDTFMLPYNIFKPLEQTGMKGSGDETGGK